MQLSRRQAQTLIEIAVQAAPNEICGLLAGSGDNVESIIPIANVAPDPVHYFALDHRAFVRAMFDIQRRGSRMIGIYHSHPTGEPIPSPTDVAQALYPDVHYVIVGLGSSQPQIAAWNIRNLEVSNVDLHLSASAQPDQLELTATGRKAIIVSAIIAVIAALLISLSLLPPAPVIP